MYKKDAPTPFSAIFSHSMSDLDAETAFWPDNFQQCYAETIEEPHPVSMSRTQIIQNGRDLSNGNVSEELQKNHDLTPLFSSKTR